jgi:hypothetical protein
MPTTLKTAAGSYLRAKPLSRGTRNEYLSTLRKWERWGGGIPIEQLRRKDIREFLDWVYEWAVKDRGTNPGRTANKAREHVRAVLYWAWEQELIDTLPWFRSPRDQRDVAGRHYLTKAEINALYFGTHKLRRPRGWQAPHRPDGSLKSSPSAAEGVALSSELTFALRASIRRHRRAQGVTSGNLASGSALRLPRLVRG